MDFCNLVLDKSKFRIFTEISTVGNPLISHTPSCPYTVFFRTLLGVSKAVHRERATVDFRRSVIVPAFEEFIDKQ